MIWNLLKSIFWCGIFHDVELCIDLAYPDIEPTEDDRGKTAICIHCHATYEVV